MSKLFIAVSLIATLTACANREVLLINDKGERRYCYEVHDSGIERFAASEQFNKCLRRRDRWISKAIGTQAHGPNLKQGQLRA